MHQVAIIGAGQLGRRHLQGLVKSSQALSVHVVDPDEASRRAVEDYIVSPDVGTLPPIRVHATLDSLPTTLELAVVATTANPRLDVIERLCHVSKVRHLILEKFLFNDSDHYARASDLFAEHGGTAWVNTPRRHFSVYRELRDRAREERLLQFTVDGGDWGLCCNSVHFVDLAQFLAGASDVRQLITRFDAGVLSSKRGGYVELTGEIEGQIGSARFMVRSIRDSAKPITVTLHYEGQTIIVEEGAGALWRFCRGPVETVTFRLPYQSEMTGKIADQLFVAGTCDLTPYVESAAAHLPLLHAFAQRAGQVTGMRAQCAIT